MSAFAAVSFSFFTERRRHMRNAVAKLKEQLTNDDAKNVTTRDSASVCNYRS